MNLYQFIEHVVAAMGGVLVPIEYCLCTVLLPEHYKDLFQGNTELLLAFDYEVSQENSDAQFVTYGSFIFETMLQIARSTPMCTQRYVACDRFEYQNPAHKIKQYLDMQAGSLEVISEKKIVGIWGLFNFVISFVFDEKFEQTHEVWVDLVNGKIDSSILKSQIFYDKSPIYPELPIIQSIQMEEAYQIALEEAEKHAAGSSLSIDHFDQIEKEEERIVNYYHELIAENRRRVLRKGTPEERENEIRQKENALQIEKEKRLNDIREKYELKTSVSLENVILYHIPLIDFECSIQHHREKYNQHFYYDAAHKRIMLGDTDAMPAG